MVIQRKIIISLGKNKEIIKQEKSKSRLSEKLVGIH